MSVLLRSLAVVIFTAIFIQLSAQDNPVKITGSYIDSSHIAVQITNYSSLPTSKDLLKQYVDSVYIWFDSIGYPDVSQLSSTNFCGYSFKGISSKAEPFDTILTVPTISSDSTSFYYLAVSLKWKNPDTTIYFDSTNMTSVLMFDTVSVENNLTVKSASYDSKDTALTVVIGNTVFMDSLADSVGIWWGFLPAVDFEDMSRVSWMSASKVSEVNPYPFKIKEETFCRATDTLYYAVAIKGRNGLVSSWSLDSVIVGRPRPKNTVTLMSKAISSYQIEVSLIYSETFDSVRIWYGTDSIALTHDISPTDFMCLYMDKGKKKDTLDLLESNKIYHFGAQIYSDNLWSIVTSRSSDTALTKSPADSLAITDTAVIDSVSFDRDLELINIKYHLDSTVAGDNIQVGVRYGLGLSSDNSADDNIVIRWLSDVKDVFPLSVREGLVYDTLYHVTVLLRKAGGAWASPTKTSSSVVNVESRQKTLISYFKGSDTIATAFDSVIVLRRGKGFKGVLNDSLFKYKVDSLPHVGFIPVGFGFRFQTAFQSWPIYVGISYAKKPLPIGVTSANLLRMYREENGHFYVEHESYVDTVQKIVWVLTNDLVRPFIIMADVFPVSVDVDSVYDTASVANYRDSIKTEFLVKDNISNVSWSFCYGRGNAGYTLGDSGTFSYGDSIVTTIVPPSYVNGDYGVRAIFIVSNGVNFDTINVSRRVITKKTDEMSIVPKRWVPVRTTAELQDTSVLTPIKAIALDSTGALNCDGYAFRMFQWAPDLGDEGEWVEYSDSTKESFSLKPGKVIWIKTAEPYLYSLGKGISTSLKEPFEIKLQPKRWTDISVPFKFKIFLSDVINTTGTLADSLYYYRWVHNGSTYKAKEMYILSLPPYDATRNTEAFRYAPLNDAYTIFNPLDTVVTLKIPPIPPALHVKSSGTAKKINSVRSVSLLWKNDSDSTDVSRISFAKSFMGDADENRYYPLAPSFSRSGVAICDDSGDNLCGHVLYSSDSKENIARVAFYNGSSESKVISYQLENLQENNDFEAVILDSSDLDDNNKKIFKDWNSVTVPPNSIKYRTVIIGSSNFINNYKTGLKSFKLSLGGVLQNPSYNNAFIRYSSPLNGLKSVSFEIYTVSGKMVWKKKLLSVKSGQGIVVWDGLSSNKQPISSGRYLLRIRAMRTGSAKVDTKEQYFMFFR